jgi:hypothetical protein
MALSPVAFVKRTLLNLVAVWLLGLLSTLSWCLLRPPNPEPIFQGKPQGFWIRSLDARLSEYLIDSFCRNLNSNVVPVLAKAVQQRDTQIHKAYRSLWPKLPMPLKKRLPVPLNGTTVRRNAAYILCVLEDEGALVGILKSYDANVRSMAAQGLWRKPDDAASLALLGALKDREQEVRRSAAFALSLGARNPTLITTSVVQAIRDNDWTAGTSLTFVK